jgi:hypothetical protein
MNFMPVYRYKKYQKNIKISLAMACPKWILFGVENIKRAFLFIFKV